MSLKTCFPSTSEPEAAFIEAAKEYFWFYQIDTLIIPFGNEYPSPEAIIAKGAGHFIAITVKQFADNFFWPATEAIKRILLDDTSVEPGDEWDCPCCAFKLDSTVTVLHAIRGYRKMKFLDEPDNLKKQKA